MLKTLKWVLIVAGVLFAVLSCGAVVTGALMSVGEQEATLSAEQNDVVTESEGMAAPAPQKTAEGFGDGTWEVGADIRPGTYKTGGPSPDGFGCYWERMKDLTGGFEAILSNGAPSGPTVVKIKKSDAGFKSQGCGRWVLQKK